MSYSHIYNSTGAYTTLQDSMFTGAKEVYIFNSTFNINTDQPDTIVQANTVSQISRACNPSLMIFWWIGHFLYGIVVLFWSAGHTNDPMSRNSTVVAKMQDPPCFFSCLPVWSNMVNLSVFLPGWKKWRLVETWLRININKIYYECWWSLGGWKVADWGNERARGLAHSPGQLLSMDNQS